MDCDTISYIIESLSLIVIVGGLFCVENVVRVIDFFEKMIIKSRLICV